MLIRKIALCVLFAATFTGCESVHYYAQAVGGQVSILNKRQSINRLLADLQIPTKQKNQFRRILDIREFAKKELNLPVNNHYLTFVELNRPYVLWNVYAAPEFDFAPKTWCYPIVGCTAYRGYFSKENARRYANGLRKEGFDVYVGGVTAYSTLGWFDDPICSTFIDFSEARLAALIFHELAHQIVYVKDEYYKLKRHWNGYAGYDPWFRNPINNAQINTVSIYNDMVPTFLQLIEQNGGDLSLFSETCQKLARFSKKERIRRLNEELGKGMNLWELAVCSGFIYPKIRPILSL